MADFRRDNSEIVHYDLPDYPVLCRRNEIPGYESFDEVMIHWHDDVELIYVVSGSIRYQLAGKTVRMGAGQGIFVNSRQLHRIVSDEVDCTLYCVVFHPSLLCASGFITRNYVNPIILDERISYVMLDCSLDWQERILQDVAKVYECKKREGTELRMQMILNDLWLLLYHNLASVSPNSGIQNDNLALVKKLMLYVQEHYSERLMISDICRHGNIGKTKCSALFSRFVNMTPMEYVRAYRVEKSIELLKNTDKSITQIAYETGFAGGSYYSEVFRQIKGCSPQQYRRMKRQEKEGSNE